MPTVPISAAEEYLSFAFEHCHRSSQKNKRMILIYLLPVKMLLVSEGHRQIVQHTPGWEKILLASLVSSTWSLS